MHHQHQQAWGSPFGGGCVHSAPPQELPAIALGAGISASSEHDHSYRAEYGRLNFVQARAGASAWCAGVNDVHQWFQVGFGGDVRNVTAVETQGRHDADQWIKEFSVRYTLDGREWYQADNGKMFNANSDRGTVVRNTFSQPIPCRAIRICPASWSQHISGRFEVYIQEEPQKRGCC